MRLARAWMIISVILFLLILTAWSVGWSFADAEIKRQLYWRRLPENGIYIKMARLKGLNYAERYFEDGERFVALPKDLQAQLIRR